VAEQAFAGRACGKPASTATSRHKWCFIVWPGRKLSGHTHMHVRIMLKNGLVFAPAAELNLQFAASALRDAFVNQSVVMEITVGIVMKQSAFELHCHDGSPAIFCLRP